jgi:hypothetical protein
MEINFFLRAREPGHPVRTDDLPRVLITQSRNSGRKLNVVVGGFLTVYESWAVENILVHFYTDNYFIFYYTQVL